MKEERGEKVSKGKERKKRKEKEEEKEKRKENEKSPRHQNSELPNRRFPRPPNRHLSRSFVIPPSSNKSANRTLESPPNLSTALLPLLSLQRASPTSSAVGARTACAQRGMLWKAPRKGVFSVAVRGDSPCNLQATNTYKIHPLQLCSFQCSPSPPRPDAFAQTVIAAIEPTPAARGFPPERHAQVQGSHSR